MEPQAAKALQMTRKMHAQRNPNPGLLIAGRTDGRMALPEQRKLILEVVTASLPTASLIATEVPADMRFARSGLQSYACSARHLEFSVERNRDSHSSSPE